jgi:hypothetical protein
MVAILKGLKFVAVGLVVWCAAALASTLLDPVMSVLLTRLLHVIQHG